MDAYHKENKIGLSVTAQNLSRLSRKITGGAANVLEEPENDEIIIFDLPAKTIDTFWEVEKEVIHSKKKREALVSILQVFRCSCFSTAIEIRESELKASQRK